jgi:hypothetical protein
MGVRQIVLGELSRSYLLLLHYRFLGQSPIPGFSMKVFGSNRAVGDCNP